MTESVAFLLDNQFVCSTELPGRLFQTVVGTGMGSKHSGELSDLTCTSGTEKQTILLGWYRKLCKIRFYARFKDDIIVIFAGTEEELDTWFDSFSQRSNCFKLQLEQKSQTNIHFLDVDIFKGEEGQLSTKPFFKPSYVGAPLSEASCHRRRALAGWPFNEIRRFACLSS